MSESDMVEVEVLEPGVVVEHRPRRRGERIAVSRAARAQLGPLVKERPLMRIRADVSCLVGGHCFAVGEERDVRPEHELAALERHAAGHVTILNPGELGLTLPRRKAERSAGLVQVKATESFECREHPRGVARGQVVELPRERGQELVWRGFATAVDWDPGKEPRVLVRSLRPADAPGRTLFVTQAEGQAMELECQGAIVRSGVVRLLALKPDCYLGPDLAPLAEGQVANVPMPLALDLVVEGHARPVGDDVPLSPVEPASPARKSRA
jgi:hypothetical protein